MALFVVSSFNIKIIKDQDHKMRQPHGITMSGILKNLNLVCLFF